MTSGSKPGGALPMLLLLLAILCGGGAYNYQRNVALEKQEPRPYRGYTDEQLEQLAAAYEGEKAKDSQRYEKASSRRATAQGKAYFQDQVDEFERVQRAGAGRKAAQLELAESESQLKRLRAELSRRAGERDRFALHMRRLLTL